MSKRKPKPAAPEFRTVAQVKAWIKKHVEPEKRGTSGRHATWTDALLDEAALWWHACEEASTWGDLRTKDIADILLTGLKPLTLADLQETLDSAYESEDESLTAAQDIEANLRQHFGLKR